MNFAGKVAIVTGGAQGIGKAYTEALLSIGMKVCICDINEEVAKKCIESFSENIKRNAIFLKGDVCSFTDLQDVFENVISVFGGLDVVVNNAGICNEDDWKKMLEINLIGVINGIKLGLKYMDKSATGRGGYIISTSSIAGFLSHLQVELKSLLGAEKCPVYCASKFGVIGVTKSCGTDNVLETTGVRVSAICPGLTHTPGFLCSLPSADKETTEKLIAERTPAKPEDIAKGLLRLLEDKRNGAVLIVDVHGLRYYEGATKEEITSIKF